MNEDMRRMHRPADMSPDNGEHEPLGEDQGVGVRFSADQVATAFEVDVNRVHNAFSGEYGLDADGMVDSRQAQELVELIIGDRPQAEREEALITLGAFTPRSDTAEPSVFEKPPGELSDRLRPSEQQPNVTAPKDADQ
ncbi:MAG TPA: hypothetical protein VGR29_03200 [Thermomicrobiales bacterium]|nr:hypothetical protein [Thermomicrobiales bacterium]